MSNELSVEEEAAMDSYPFPASFVVTWADGHVSVKSEKDVSRMYDLADCDAMEDVTGVYALNQDGELVRITLGTMKADAGFPEETFIYGYTPLYAGERLAGYVSWTDH